MSNQNLKAEIDFFNRLEEKGVLNETILSDKVYDFIFYKINPYIKSCILEAGCGTGNFGPVIRNYNKNKILNLIGIDINKNLLKYAIKTGAYNKVVCGDLNNKDIFEAESFETIIATFVIHHFQDILPVISNFYYWLKKGGFLIILDPNGSNFIVKISLFSRKIISIFINTADYFSPNESHKSIKEFRNSLVNFKIYSIDSFDYRTNNKIKLKPFNLINFLSLIREVLFKIYRFFSFSKFKGSSLIIVAQKNENDENI